MSNWPMLIFDIGIWMNVREITYRLVIKSISIYIFLIDDIMLRNRSQYIFFPLRFIFVYQKSLKQTLKSVFENKIIFWICVLVLWIPKGYCVVKKLGCNGRIKAFWHTTTFCIPESFNANNLHQLFDHKITFVNSKCEKLLKVKIPYTKH